METPPYLELLRPKPTGGTIVTFSEPNVDRQRSSLESALRAQGARGAVVAISSPEAVASGAVDVRNEARIIGNGIAVVPQSVAPAAAIANMLDAEADVAEARPEFYLYAIDSPPAVADTTERTWGVDAVGALASAASGLGIKIAVLDTGFATAHPDFVGRTIVTQSFVEGQTVEDGNGHGTHCIGTAAGPLGGGNVPRYGIAYEADIYAVKVLSNEGFGAESDIIDGIFWAVSEACEVISMSLGRAVQPGERPSVAYERAGRAALDKGCLIIAAAGNNSARDFGFIAPVGAPANSASIMAVAAIDPQFGIARFSCGGINAGGGEIDIAGPGVGVFSSWPLPRTYHTIGGTSMACPHVAGIAALYASSDPTLRGVALWDALVRTVRPLDLPPRDVGAGLVQAPVLPPTCVAATSTKAIA